MAAAAAFAAAYESQFGAADHPAFFTRGGFREALREAQSQFKLLLVYLHSPEHQDTPHFCRTVLSSPEVAAAADAGYVTWAADLRGREARAPRPLRPPPPPFPRPSLNCFSIPPVLRSQLTLPPSLPDDGRDTTWRAACGPRASLSWR